jgi:hypothetical protein
LPENQNLHLDLNDYPKTSKSENILLSFEPLGLILPKEAILDPLQN